jgi:class 3 adenylate cyclase
VRYTESSGIEVAYRVLGAGPRTVVHVPGLMVANLDDLVESREMSEIAFGPIADWSRLVLFDRRGQGLSGRTFGLGTAEDRMDDIRAVMDATHTDDAVLLTHHDGASFALLFAATYPERVTALVLLSVAAPRTRWAPDYPIGHPIELLEEFEKHVAREWGTGSLPTLMDPGLGTIPRNTLARWERASCTPRTAAEHFRLANKHDVRGALPSVSAPVLIVHGADDTMPVAWAHYLVEHLPSATLLEPPGPGLQGSPKDRAPLWEAIEEFVTGERVHRPVDADRVLATVLFVDIVSSTEHLAAVGDHAWSALLSRFRTLVRAEIARFSGRMVNTRGDDVLATFDGSTRAVRCASVIVETARQLDVEVRAGLHTGEVERRQEGDIAGLAVHVGARVSAQAGPGEVLVTATLRDLTVGSGIEFVDRGRHTLKGVPGEWQLLAVAHT